MTQFHFYINGFTPETIPMGRLAEYLTELSALLGSRESVHFVDVESGSVDVVCSVEREAVPKVTARMNATKDLDNAPSDVKTAYENIDKKLRQDNADGCLYDSSDSKIIQFPGAKAAPLQRIGPVRQRGSIEGEITKLGGKGNDYVSLELTDRRSGLSTTCRVKKALALNELLALQWREIVRLHGNGTWYRYPSGGWVLDSFVVDSFEILDDSPLSEIVGKLREIGLPGWRGIEDPESELEQLRHGGE